MEHSHGQTSWFIDILLEDSLLVQNYVLYKDEEKWQMKLDFFHFVQAKRWIVCNF